MRSLLAQGGKDKEARLSEAARDVAGMANEQGGEIIYGLDEDPGGGFRRARSLEEGFAPEHKINRERFLQFIRDRVQPSLPDIDAIDVRLAEHRYALVVLVPQARGVARQTGDRLFWRRDAQGLRKMSVQEIEDVRSRAYRPTLELAAGDVAVVTEQDLIELTIKPSLQLQVRNHSQATALFAVVTVGVGEGIGVSYEIPPDWRRIEVVQPWNIFRLAIASGSSPLWSPMTPGFVFYLPPIPLTFQLRPNVDLFKGRPLGVARIDHDG